MGMSDIHRRPQPQTMSLSTIAFVLAGLTAGGGITGYVHPPKHPPLPFLQRTPTLTSRDTNKTAPRRFHPLPRSRVFRRRPLRTRRLPPAEPRLVRRRSRLARQCRPGWIVHPQGHQDAEGSARGTERASCVWVV